MAWPPKTWLSVCVNSVALPGNNRVSGVMQLLNYVDGYAVSKRAVTSSIVRRVNDSTEKLEDKAKRT